MLDFSSVWVIAGLLVLVVIVILVTFARMLRKVGPHEALVITAFEDHEQLPTAARLSCRCSNSAASSRSS